MKIEELKSEFHLLIDQINDADVLEQFYGALNSSAKKGPSVWPTLSPEQQQAVLDAYDESEDESNLIPISEVIAKYKR